MSLKAFHIFFITLSMIVTLGFGFWAIRYYLLHREIHYVSLGLLSFIATGALSFYLYRVRLKFKKMEEP